MTAANCTNLSQADSPLSKIRRARRFFIRPGDGPAGTVNLNHLCGQSEPILGNNLLD
jgi:hypothetical protein